MTTFIVSDDQLMDAIHKALAGMDAYDFAKIAGELLGGKCMFHGIFRYAFVTNEHYMGALDEYSNSNSRVTIEHEDTDGCCECGNPDHTCQDCPTFQGKH